MCFVLQLVLLGKVIRAPLGSPVQTATFIPNSLQPATTRYIRRVGRPRMEWTSTVLREDLRLAGGEHKICMTWRRIVTYGIRTPKMYTTTGFGPRKNREMAGVDHLVLYMQTALKYNTFYIHHPECAKRPRGGVYTNCYILQQFAYATPNGPHQPFPYFF